MASFLCHPISNADHNRRLRSYKKVTKLHRNGCLAYFSVIDYTKAKQVCETVNLPVAF